MASGYKGAMILREKLRDHRQILSEDFFLERTLVLATKVKFWLANFGNFGYFSTLIALFSSSASGNPVWSQSGVN